MNVLAQCRQWTNAFAAARGNRTAMRPFAKLPWTLVSTRDGHVKSRDETETRRDRDEMFVGHEMSPRR